jgi:parallel beta-helix repeat protein
VKAERGCLPVAFLLVVGAFGLLVTVIPENVEASTLFVGGSGPGNYTEVQSAIENATTGSTVFVHSGVYYEHLDIRTAISLVGEDRNTTILDGGGIGQVVYVDAHDVSIVGFTIMNSGSDTDDAGIYASWPDYLYIANNNIRNNEDGIRFFISHNNVITNNNLSFNRGTGIGLTYSQNNIVTHNTAWANQIGIVVNEYYNNTVANNTLFNNTYGIWVSDSDDNIIVNNAVSYGQNGMILLQVKRNTIANNMVSNYTYGIQIADSADNTLIENDVYGNRWGVRVSQFMSSNNTVAYNDIFLNTDEGIYFHRANGNLIHHNNIVSNGNPPVDSLASNQWDDGYPSGGNYWGNDYVGLDDFSGPNQDQPGIDGIGDTPKIIDSDSRDRYPLMSPYAGDTLPPLLFITSPADGQTFGYVPINVTGSAFDVGNSGLQYVEVSVDGVNWPNAQGTTAWYISVNLVPGPNLIRARALDNAGNPSGIARVTVTYAPPLNIRPIASFSVAPSTGSVNTTFTVNASQSSDVEDPLESLQVRWDWEDDSTWDTSWSKTKTSQHMYQNPGTHSIRLEVKDSQGLSNNTTRQVLVTNLPGNQSPTCTIESPDPGSTIVNTTMIQGSASDPDGSVVNVQGRIDGGSWIQAEGLSSWSIIWDSTTVSNGEHTIYARSFDGTQYSTVASVTITVENIPYQEPDDEEDSDDIWPWLAVVLIILLVALILSFLLIVSLRKRKKVRDDDIGEK